MADYAVKIVEILTDNATNRWAFGHTMNILMALSQLEVTGAEVYATQLGDALTKKGHCVRYISDTLTCPHQGQFFKLRFNKRSVFRRLWHIAYLVYMIKKHGIQVVHAHSRASSWSCHVACKLTRTAMMTTIHGKQPVHASSKRMHMMGDKAVAICDEIRQHLVRDLGVTASKIEQIPNGINTEQFYPRYENHADSLSRASLEQSELPVITIIGRLTGPKGDVCYNLLQTLNFEQYTVQVLTGSDVPERFQAFASQVNFLPYCDDVERVIHASDVIVGAGRVAMEALLCAKPVIAVGESQAIGWVNNDNWSEAVASNFGDIAFDAVSKTQVQLAQDIEKACADGLSACKELAQKAQQTFGLTAVCNQVEELYQSIYTEKHKYEMPVLMYHRFIDKPEDAGIHGTYIDIKKLEKQFKWLKRFGYESLTFADFKQHGLAYRFKPGKKFFMLTVDDGYVDNLTLLLPLLEKYQFKAVVYIVSGESFNRWDVEAEIPEKKVPLMDAQQLKIFAASEYIEIGGHTLTHPRLSKLSDEAQITQIEKNKQALESLLEQPMISFAYPYGDYNDSTVEHVKRAGYEFAVATDSGPFQFHKDPFIIRRLGIFPNVSLLTFYRRINGKAAYKKSGFAKQLKS